MDNDKDQCPKLPENYNGFDDLDGCPEIDEQKNCNPYGTSCEDVLCPGSCYSCPCQFADYLNALAPGDKIHAKLFDAKKLYLYDSSFPVLIDDYIDFNQ
ncbi:MAG: hypothetical protein GXP45_05730 [bacterium]|nr:hypothetical protein [bacterium]